MTVEDGVMRQFVGARQILVLGDLDVGIAHERFTAIGDLAIAMLGDAVRAYVDPDPELAKRTIETEDRSRVEAYCEANELKYERLENGGLRTSQVNPATAAGLSASTSLTSTPDARGSLSAAASVGVTVWRPAPMTGR